MSRLTRLRVAFPVVDRAAVAFRKAPWAELGAAAALLAGWASLTWAIAAIAPPRIVWRASVGLLLLALFGFKLLYVMARDGLYTLTREKK